MTVQVCCSDGLIPAGGTPALGRAAIGRYPGYGGPRDVSGTFVVAGAGPRAIAVLGLLEGLEASVTGGWSVHVGTTCDDAALVRAGCVCKPAMQHDHRLTSSQSYGLRPTAISLSCGEVECPRQKGRYAMQRPAVSSQAHVCLPHFIPNMCRLIAFPCCWKDVGQRVRHECVGA